MEQRQEELRLWLACACPMHGQSRWTFEQTSRMVDAFLDAGFNYFDTAHGYHQRQERDGAEDLPDQPLSP